MPLIYTAPIPAYCEQKPYSTWEKLTVLPVIWRYAKHALNYLFGTSLSKLIVPALSRDPLELEHSKIQLPSDLSITKYQIITHDNAVLDTIEINPSLSNYQDIHDLSYIINFVGNGSLYEDDKVIEDMILDAQHLHLHVVAFNYRGVGHSTGYPASKDDLVIDGIAQVQRLLDAGINPHHITLKGHSLGGSIATLVTAYFHAQGIRINLFNNRSFSTITNVVVGHIRTLGYPNGHEEGFLQMLIGWILKPVVKLALMLTKWEINADDAYHTIPLAQKQYIAVRTSDNQRNHSVADDPVITDYGSLHESLTKVEQHQESLVTLSSEDKTEDAHDVALTRLIQIEADKAHTASDFFEEFVQEVNHLEPKTSLPEPPKRKKASEECAIL